MSLDARLRVRGVDRVVDSIKDAIEDGARVGAVETVQNAEYVAKGRIIEAGAIFEGDLLGSFEIEYRESNGRFYGVLKNTSDHAAPIEFGAEYNEKGPPLGALIPWVRAKMTGFTVPDDEVTNMPDPDDLDTEVEVTQGNYHASVDIQEFADRETIERAFWLQQHIKENGIDALRYMRAADEYLKNRSSDDVADAIWTSLKSRL